MALVNSRGSISFKKQKSYSVFIHLYEFPMFQMHVESLNVDVARIWFSDNHRNPIPVPPNTLQRDGEGRVSNDFNGSFFITWLDSHSILHNGVVIFKVNNQRKVSVHSSCEHWVVRNALGIPQRRDGVRLPIPPPVVEQHNEDEDDEEDEEEE